ncbi:MAG: AMP-binding protein [SAR324 cluster bacterium]
MTEWFPKRTLGCLPAEAAARFGEREALCCSGKRWSFRQFSEDVDAAARALLALGIRRGDNVSLWLPNRPEWLHLMFGLLKAGAVLVPLNTRLRAQDLRYVLGQSHSSTLIATDRSGPADYFAILKELFPALGRAAGLDGAAAGFPDLRRLVLVGAPPAAGTVAWSGALDSGRGVSAGALAARAAEVSPDDPALILYTSGTTGFPKGVVHAHAMVRAMTDHANRMGVTTADTILTYLPLFHIFGFTEGPLVSMLTGARQVLTVAFDADEVLDLIERERATIIHGFDTHFKDLVEAQARRPRDVSSLRTGIAAAGMSSSTPIIRRANAALVRTLSAFGMSECNVGACLSFLDSTEEQRCEASGYPAPSFEIAVIDPATGKPQPAGMPGEIVVRGYMVMRGYYNKPEETARTIDADGWLHSGDLGLIRPDGCLRFMGRTKDMLKVGGENVDPMEVEALLLGHPGIQQVAIVGAPDARLSEVGVAFVLPRPGHALTEEEVLAFCKGKIAGFKLPRRAVLVEALPMTSSGKIQKAKLREWAKENLVPRP